MTAPETLEEFVRFFRINNAKHHIEDDDELSIFKYYPDGLFCKDYSLLEFAQAVVRFREREISELIEKMTNNILSKIDRVTTYGPVKGETNE